MEDKEKITKTSLQSTKESEEDAALAPPLPPPQPELRAMSLYGDLEQERCADVIHSMLYLRETGLDYSTGAITPIDFYISTWGGSAVDMFAIYDVMRQIKKDCKINTIGLGKVMSAGVLLLAAGTKGSRKIGQNCRVMIHGVVSGQHGNLHDLENEMEEAKWTQKRYVESLARETKMTKRQIQKLMEKKINVYFDAEEAIKLGIADEIV